MADFHIPLDIKSLELIAQSIDKNGNIILEAISKNTNSTTHHKCQKPATKRNGVAPTRLIRHLPVYDAEWKEVEGELYKNAA